MRRRRERETPDFAAFVRRSIRAHGRRVADADPEDLAELVAMHEVLDQAIRDAVVGMRANYGVSWARIGRAVGLTRQGAQQRYQPSEKADAAAPMPGQVDLWS